MICMATFMNGVQTGMMLVMETTALMLPTPQVLVQVQPAQYAVAAMAMLLGTAALHIGITTTPTTIAPVSGFVLFLSLSSSP